jgi:hypothetical protein
VGVVIYLLKKFVFDPRRAKRQAATAEETPVDDTREA